MFGFGWWLGQTRSTNVMTEQRTSRLFGENFVVGVLSPIRYHNHWSFRILSERSLSFSKCNESKSPSLLVRSRMWKYKSAIKVTRYTDSNEIRWTSQKLALQLNYYLSNRLTVSILCNAGGRHCLNKLPGRLIPQRRCFTLLEGKWHLRSNISRKHAEFVILTSSRYMIRRTRLGVFRWTKRNEVGARNGGRG